MEMYKSRCEGFGMNALIVDGHDVKALLAALKNAKETKDKPTALILQTYKGKG